MASTEKLERRVQQEQDVLSRANLTGNDLIIAMAEQGVRDAERALHEARLENGDY